MNYWAAVEIIKQATSELGLKPPTTLQGTDDATATQFLALLNSSGNELLEYYPWQQLCKEWAWFTVPGQGEYNLPADWAYFVDQTQWDRTNHWPLLGPKSAQEWAWLKGGLLAAAPRMRYRVKGSKFCVWPIPGQLNGEGQPTTFQFAMEYVSNGWVAVNDQVQTNMVTKDSDLVQFDPWLVVKHLKLKFYMLKAFDTSGVSSEFMRIYNSLTGKDKGAPKLSLAPVFPPLFIGPWSIPDGSWDVSGGTP